MISRVLVLEHQRTAISAMVDLLQREGVRRGVLLLNGETVQITDHGTFEIPPHLAMSEEVIVEYKLKRDMIREPTIFQNARKSKGERKRNKANRWS